jgi:hypothetical protein
MLVVASASLAAGCFDPESCARPTRQGPVELHAHRFGEPVVTAGYVAAVDGTVTSEFKTGEDGRAELEVVAGSTVVVKHGDTEAFAVQNVQPGDVLRLGQDRAQRPSADFVFSFSVPDWAPAYRWLTPCGDIEVADGERVRLPDECVFPPGVVTVWVVALDDARAPRGYARVEVTGAFDEPAVDVEVPPFQAPEATMEVALDNLPEGYGALVPRLALVHDATAIELLPNVDGSFPLPEGAERLRASGVASRASESDFDPLAGPTDAIVMHVMLAEPVAVARIDMSEARFGTPPGGQRDRETYWVERSPDFLGADAAIARDRRGGLDWHLVMSACAPDDGVRIPDTPENFTPTPIDYEEEPAQFELTFVDVDGVDGYDAYVGDVGFAPPADFAPFAGATVRIQSTL